MVDLGVVGWLVAGTSALPAIFIVVRITHYEDKIPNMITEVNTWLGEVETQLQTEIEALAGVQRANRNFEKVFSITSSFSAIKGMQSELDTAEKNNSSWIDLDIATVVSIIATGILYYGSTFPDYNATYNFSALATFGTVISALLWVASIWAFYTTQSRYSRLKRLVRTRRLD